LNIAIDGPAGSGKSTVAKMVAQRLGFAYLDTGAMYRAVAWRALQSGVDLSEPLAQTSIDQLVQIAENEPIEFGYQPGESLPSRVFINHTEVTEQIREAAVDRAVTPVSAEPGVREALVEQQRRFSQVNNTVMEGRDIGTVVLPAADLKIFLTASAEVRAERRTIQNAARHGASFDQAEYQRTLADIQRRDAYDSSRPISPLRPAADSIELDSTALHISEVVDQIVRLAEQKAARS